MKTIWKYEINKVVQELEIPFGAKFLHVGNQNGHICLWFEVESENKKETRRFEIAGTGKAQLDIDKKYLGSMIFHNHAFVWHIYEITEYVGKELD